MKKVVFVSPIYNSSDHLGDLIESVKEQNNENWEHIIIDDMSTDDSFIIANELIKDDNRFTLLKNNTRKYSLRNIVETARKFKKNKDVIIAIIDGDDALCNENTVSILLNEYKEGIDTVWTMHTWDINNVNISNEMQAIDPYQQPWVSSHLKTFRSTLINNVSDANFKNLDNEWFTSGCDQALYLPLLHLSKESKFINEICYLFRMNSKSVESRKFADRKKFNTINLVRSRGFLK